MIEKLVDLIINKQLKDKILTSEDEKIYRYGYILLFEVFLNTVIAFTIGIIFSELNIVMFFFLMYVPLRSFCGGWHADKIWKCTIISNVIIALQLLGKRFILHHMTTETLIGFYVICLLCILFIAPLDTVAKKIDKNERHLYKIRIRWIATVQTFIFIIFILFDVNEFAFSLMSVYVVQNIMLLLELTKKKLG